MLALAAKHGYESRNQECTFALIHHLIETKKIKIGKKQMEEISRLNPDSTRENPTIMDIREIQ